MLQIYDIDFSCPHDDFMNGLQSYLYNYGNCDMRAVSTENSTRNGKYMYKIEVTSPNDPNTTTILFEKNSNNGDIIFAPSGFKSFGGTFYKVDSLSDSVEGTDDDTSEALAKYLAETAKLKKGKFVCKLNKLIYCIVNGNTKQAKECIVDSNGSVYGSKEVSTVTLADGTSMVCYGTKLPEWNKERRIEDPDFAAILTDKTTTIQEKYTLIGKYVMMLRAKEEITSEEFKDLFVQAGAADGYANDKTLSMIYKLLKN